jgi:hypothetical protein
LQQDTNGGYSGDNDLTGDYPIMRLSDFFGSDELTPEQQKALFDIEGKMREAIKEQANNTSYLSISTNNNNAKKEFNDLLVSLDLGSFSDKEYSFISPASQSAAEVDTSDLSLQNRILESIVGLSKEMNMKKNKIQLSSGQKEEQTPTLNI